MFTTRHTPELISSGTTTNQSLLALVASLGKLATQKGKLVKAAVASIGVFKGKLIATKKVALVASVGKVTKRLTRLFKALVASLGALMPHKVGRILAASATTGKVVKMVGKILFAR